MSKRIIVRFLKWTMKKTLRFLNEIDDIVNVYKLQNEQYVLDFYDKVNEISVRK